MRSIEPALAELERAFVALTPIFGRDMPLPVITIQSQGRRQAFGWFSKDRWARGNGNGDSKLPEVNICAESLARSVEDTGETLIHEMVHYANALDGIHDCSKNQYHNKRFKARCESVGLICEPHPTRGWATTSLSTELRARVQKVAINKEAFSLYRPDQERQRAPTKMKKWMCGCTIIRAAVEVQALCLKCNSEFKLQEPSTV
jgi:hypothetical protein